MPCCCDGIGREESTFGRVLKDGMEVVMDADEEVPAGGGGLGLLGRVFFGRYLSNAD